ncbi:MAG: metallophosphoesterase [Candidatus Pacebacteria bacterium]|nr:metallophosphoesterase [Candidatus Paceibacterota bacterium]
MAKLSKITAGFVFLLLLFLGYSYFIEPSTIKVENQVFDLACLSQNINNEKIVQISDLHFTDKTSPDRIERIFKEIKKIQPSFIFITGDLVSNKGGGESMVKLTKQLSEIAKTYIIFGNWDYDVFGAGAGGFEKELKDAGSVVLVDEVSQLQLGQEMISLAGINDIYRTGSPKESLQKVLGQASSQESCKILLAHTPDIMKQDLAKKFDLILAGHTHGGQVYLPLITKEIVLRIIGGKDFAKDRFKVGDSWLYVNRGLGVSGFPLRFLSPPEITVLTLK